MRTALFILGLLVIQAHATSRVEKVSLAREFPKLGIHCDAINDPDTYPYNVYNVFGKATVELHSWGEDVVQTASCSEKNNGLICHLGEENTVLRVDYKHLKNDPTYDPTHKSYDHRMYTTKGHINGQLWDCGLFWNSDKIDSYYRRGNGGGE